jgi:hypothetical protein
VQVLTKGGGRSDAILDADLSNRQRLLSFLTGCTTNRSTMGLIPILASQFPIK